ncbi:unnamed protein product [Closterium sp. NIES-65]|nr:unnamed protein product [Closterium sp. NIES-65]
MPSPAVSPQSSQQLTSGVVALPLPLSPAPPAASVPLPAPPPSSPPPLAPPPLSSSAVAPPMLHPFFSTSLRLSSSRRASAAAASSHDERWWSGEMWESPPQPVTLWGREWDIESDFVKDILRWEKRMVAVGECLSHVAMVLKQLHAGLMARNLVLRDPQLTEPQQGVFREAVAHSSVCP